MDLDRVQAQMDLATASAQKQIELNQQSLANNLDAADRIIMRKAAEATIKISQLPTVPDPQ